MVHSFTHFRGYKWLTKGDVDAYFGLLFDGMSKVLAASGIMMFGFGMPADIVLGRVLPGLALATFFGNMFYAYEAYRLARKENRQDTTAQPYGVGAGQVFGWLFLIIGPVFWKTGDPILAWQVGLGACFIGGVVEVVGAFIGRGIIKVIPRAALLGNLAAGAVIWLSLVGMLNIFDKPYTALIPLAIVIIAYFGKMRLPFGLPAGLMAIVLGSVLAWTMGTMEFGAVIESVSSLKLNGPTLSITDIFYGIKNIKDFLPIILPLQIANFLTTLQGLESAAVAGDKYPVRSSMTMDGVGTIIGAMFGNPFPTTVYYGHPSWKELNARAGYSVLNGITYLIIGMTGAVGVLTAIIPFQAVMPVLVFVGFSMSVQTFSETNKHHVGAIMIAFIPLIAQYVETGVNATLTAVGTDLVTVGYEAFGVASFPIRGIVSLSQGAFLSSLLLAAWMVNVVERKWLISSIYAMSLSLCAAIGLIHSPQVGWMPEQSISFAVIYLAIAVICVSFKFKRKVLEDIQTINI
jgi:adenine/guanine/hypoxanthine permease